MEAGSAPSAITTAIVSPRSAISRQCAAPTLCRCQCMATVFFPVCITRYIPTFRMPRFGSFVMTIGSVMYAPPSSGQQVMMGSASRSTSSPRQITCWQGGVPLTIRGGNFATSIRRGSIDSLPMIPSGTLRSISCVMRSPWSSRCSTPSDIAIRDIEPNRLIPTGKRDREPSRRMTCSNRRAGPPPGIFITRSLISHSSR